MTRIKPTRQAKTQNNGFFKLDTGCGKLAVTITDGDDGYPIRVILEPIGGGCQGGIECLRRTLTYLLECNIDIEAYADGVLEKVVCPSGKSKKMKEPDKQVFLSCSKAVSHALKEHLNRRKNAVSS